MNATELELDSESSSPLLLLEDESFVFVYRAMVVASLSISFIAIALSLTLMISMTLPLLFESRRKQYSTYNLYLAYLSIPDFINYTYVVHLILTRHDRHFYPLVEEDGTAHWMFEDNFFDHNVYSMYVAANLYINSFLIYECYLLLKDSARVRRHKPPSVSRVTKQAMIAYAAGISAFLFEWAVADVLVGRRIWFGIYQGFTFFIYGNVPLWFLAFMWWRIHKEGLVQSTISMYSGRLKLLVTYFVRMVVMYLACTLSGTICYMVYWSTKTNNRMKVILYNVFLIMVGLQAIGNFCVSLTKPDTRKFVLDWLKGDYCEGLVRKSHLDDKEDKPDVSDAETEPVNIYNDPYLGLDEAVELNSRHMSVMAEPTTSRRASLPTFNSSFIRASLVSAPSVRSRSISVFRTDSTGKIYREGDETQSSSNDISREKSTAALLSGGAPITFTTPREKSVAAFKTDSSGNILGLRDAELPTPPSPNSNPAKALRIDLARNVLDVIADSSDSSMDLDDLGV